MPSNLVSWGEAILLHLERKRERERRIIQALEKIPPETRSERLRAALDKIQADRERIDARTPKVVPIRAVR
jgi:hypothetical protein